MLSQEERALFGEKFFFQLADAFTSYTDGKKDVSHAKSIPIILHISQSNFCTWAVKTVEELDGKYQKVSYKLHRPGTHMQLETLLGQNERNAALFEFIWSVQP